MRNIKDIPKEELTLKLTYVGFILVAFELMKSLIVTPIKFFYKDTTFSGTSLFHSYEKDVMSRHKNEFEACLLYLRDFMKAIDLEDFLTIQELREHRNNLAHNLVEELPNLDLQSYKTLLEKVEMHFLNSVTIKLLWKLALTLSLRIK